MGTTSQGGENRWAASHDSDAAVLAHRWRIGSALFSRTHASGSAASTAGWAWFGRRQHAGEGAEDHNRRLESVVLCKLGHLQAAGWMALIVYITYMYAPSEPLHPSTHALFCYATLVRYFRRNTECS